MKDIKLLIRRYALANAIAHEGVGSVKSVLGKLLAEKPEFRKDVLKVKSIVEEVIEEINKLSFEEQKKMLEKIGAPERAEKEEKKELPQLDVGKTFVVRFAPNPDGAMHIGNARVAILNDEYAKRYKGKYILRFDDTDPKKKVPEKVFYDMIKEDLKWLGIKWHKEVIASKRLNIYYKYAEKLIEMGKAYVCLCDIEKWKTLRNKKIACKCRNLSKKEHMKRWKKMKSWKLKEGEAVVRIKTSMDLKNPAVRDWAAFRIVDHPKHPFSKRKLWPLYNFASAIDDHLLGVTHIIRGQEHSTNESKQRFIYNYFNWKYPKVYIVGRFSVSEVIMSKSVIREGIKKHKFTGWNDIRLATIATLKRRGFTPQAIRQLIVDIGLKSSDITVPMDTLASYNRKIIDSIAKRFFFTPNPIKIKIKNAPRIKEIKIPMHPTENLGFRKIKISNEIYISKDDYETYNGVEVRLKELYNIKLGENIFTSKKVKNIPKLQWVSKPFVHVKLLMTDNILEGYGEKDMAKLKPGEIIQLERIGFGCVESTGKTITIVFAHK